MKITFIIPFKSLTGGIKVVFEYANRFIDKGHKVTIIYPIIPYRFGDKIFNLKRLYRQAHGLLANLIRGNKVNWFSVKAEIKGVPYIHNKFITDADVVIGTAWPTAHSVAKLAPQKGEKFYFIQHYEVWEENKELIDKSYLLPLKQIVIASWLEKLMKTKFNGNVVACILNGIDLRTFYNNGKVFNKKKRILMLYSQQKWKGISDALSAIEIVRTKYPDIQLVMYGLKRGNDIPPETEFHERPDLEELRKLYCSCDIFISASLTEGFGLPAMEAMACKCAVAATNVGGIPDYAIHGKTVLASKPGDVRELAQNIIKFLENPEILKEFSFAGSKHSANFTWERATDKFETTLNAFVDKKIR